jgi:hypothetical protein
MNFPFQNIILKNSRGPQNRNDENRQDDECILGKQNLIFTTRHRTCMK